MFNRLIFIVVLVLICQKGWAQPYVVGGKTRHRFAQLNLGIDQRFFHSTGSQSAQLNIFGQVEHKPLNPFTETRILIGGTHFWGHADFYIAIPILGLGGSGFKTEVETGAKYFPWSIAHKKLRPFVGAAWMPFMYQQGDGVALWRSGLPVQAGVAYYRNKHLIEMGVAYNLRNRFNYYISQSSAVETKTQALSFSLAYKYQLDVTLSAEKDWQSGRTKKITEVLDSLKRLNGFTLAIGPSSAFFLKPSAYINNKAPFADNHKSAQVFAEFGLGYYLHKPDVQVNLAYRSINSVIEAYGFKNELQRKALSFEVYKFIADYHGFVPFIGLAASLENLQVNETNASETFEKGVTTGSPGITFGWDIRPNRIQSWYLRTNLRYFPFLNMTMQDGLQISYNQLEFNFIQLVVFPERFF